MPLNTPSGSEEIALEVKSLRVINETTIRGVQFGTKYSASQKLFFNVDWGKLIK